MITDDSNIFSFTNYDELTLKFDSSHPWYDWMIEQHQKQAGQPLHDRNHATLHVTLGGIHQEYHMTEVEGKHFGHDGELVVTSTWRAKPQSR